MKLEDALRGAAEIVRGLYGAGGEVTAKLDGSPLTEADRRVDAYLKEALPAVRPAAWLSEETRDDPARLGSEWCWVVDPLDGTKEFSRGIPEFAVSVGLVRGGEAVAGGVVNPATGEGGIAGLDGAVRFWGGLEGRPVSASLAAASASVSRTEIDDRSALPLVPWLAEVRPVGSVAYKLLRVAAGADELTFTVQGKSEWDLCGGVALVAAAGKVYRRFDGLPLRFNQPSTRIEGGGVAGPAHLVDEFINRLERP
jgi:myo-inositol-1(or 4)-monophosphatase